MAYTTVDNPELYFQVKTYTGTGSSQSITFDGSENMSPNWVWMKCRDATKDHMLFDTVRGVQKSLRSNSNNVEDTGTNFLSSFDSDGFTAGGNGKTNGGSSTYVAWNWKETATAGFDIVSYTGNGSARTISHSLSAIPKMIIIKNRDDTDSWRVYHASTGNGGSLMLNLTNAFASDSTMWNNTSPTSSVFSLGDHDNVNGNGHKFIAYCFAEKQGYSKFGSYTGNGNADGVFIYTGFKPAFVLFKRTSSTSNWSLFDNKRNTFNITDSYVQADTSAAEQEYSDIYVDFLSNGIKQRGTNISLNSSGDSFIYMCFAENPFVTSSGIPACAR